MRQPRDETVASEVLILSEFRERQELTPHEKVRERRHGDEKQQAAEGLRPWRRGENDWIEFSIADFQVTSPGLGKTELPVHRWPRPSAGEDVCH